MQHVGRAAPLPEVLPSGEIIPPVLARNQRLAQAAGSGLLGIRIDDFSRHDEFLKAFAAVPQWQDAGYEKPKFHPSAHFSEELAELGPFRSYWCLPWRM